MENPRMGTRGNEEEDPNEGNWIEEDRIWLTADGQKTIFERATCGGTWFW